MTIGRGGMAQLLPLKAFYTTWKGTFLLESNRKRDRSSSQKPRVQSTSTQQLIKEAKGVRHGLDGRRNGAGRTTFEGSDGSSLPLPLQLSSQFGSTVEHIRPDLKPISSCMRFPTAVPFNVCMKEVIVSAPE